MDYTYFNNSNTPEAKNGWFKNFSWDSSNIKNGGSWYSSKTINAVKNLFTGATPEGVYVGIGGIIFDIIGDYSVNMNNALTNNVTERGAFESYSVSDNKNSTRVQRFYNDNVACQPTEIVIDAYVGDCFVNRSNETGDYFQTTLKICQTITNIVPSFSNSVAKVKQKAKNVINTADYAVSLAANIVTALQGISKQRQAFQYVETLRQCQYPVTISLPTLGNFPNMMVKSVKWTQPRESENYSRCSFVFQEWRQTDVLLRKYDLGNPSLTTGTAREVRV